jgi:predicted RNase H-like nuclease
MPASKHALPYKMVAGVMPCPAGWLMLPAKLHGVTMLTEDPEVLPKFADIIDYRPAFSVIALDSPVGLVDEPNGRFRQCDIEARRTLGWPRRVGIPPAPSRPALHAGSYEKAKLIDPWLTPLIYRRFKWIREVDEEMAPFRQRTVYSTNPELSFYLLNMDQPLRYSKHWEVGYTEREMLLRNKFPGIESVFQGRPPDGASRNHLVDAAAILWTARRLAGKVVQRLPIDPEWDASGLRMELVR